MRLTTEAKAIRDQIDAVIRPTTFQDNALSAMVRNAGHGDLPLAVGEAAYGLGWAIETGRLDGRTARAIRSLSHAKLVGMVASIAATTSLSGDVPAWVRDNFKTV